MMDMELMDSLFSVVDGQLIRKKSTGTNTKIGRVAGRIDPSSGYYRVQVYGRKYLIHRIIFALHYGFLPKEIDHIDNDQLNNKPENLRAATHSQNLCNVAPRAPSGFKGVYWHAASNSWSASITINGKLKHLGLFKTPEAANEVRSSATEKHHGEYAFSAEMAK